MDENLFKRLNKVPLTFQEDHISRTYYQMDPETFDDLMDKLLWFVLLIPETCTPIQKATLLYTVLSRCLTYDYHVRRNPKTKKPLERQSYSYAGAVLNGTAVCNGISQLYAKLCQACGIRCNIVEGYGSDPKKQVLHAWVQIWLPDENGELLPAHCDLTWDLGNEGCFQYFLKSDEYMMAHQHLWNPDRGKAEGMQKFYPCPKNWEDIPEVPEEAVELMCRVFKAMKLPETLVLPA